MYDCMIVGCGIVGLTQALLLAQNPELSIALLDAKAENPTWNSKNYDPRVYSITPGSQSVLQSLGVWQEVAANRIGVFKHMHVWDGAGGGEVQFHHAEVHRPELGFIVEENLLRTGLFNRVLNQPNIKMIRPVVLKELHHHPEKIEVILENEILSTRLLIAADGAKSIVREKAGIALKQEDYQHTAIIAHVETETPHDYTARQCFTRLGPLAFLPLENEYQSSIVWSVAPDVAADLLNLSEEEFAAKVAEAFQHCLGKIRLFSKRHSYPLIERHADRYIQERLALIGDAAHTIHPLAGQGVNLGIADTAVLADVVKNAVATQRDYGSIHMLRRFERVRKSQNALMMKVVKGLKTLFSSSTKPIVWSRSFGFNVVNRSKFLKSIFMNQAMGSTE